MTHIPNDFSLFYINATRRRVGVVTKNATDLSQHEALKGADVPKMTLCVTYGAPRVGTHFRLLTRCSEYAVIPMLLGTHVPQPTVCVTFSAPRRSIPASLLDRLLAAWAAKAAQGLRIGSFWRPFGQPRSPRDALRTLLRHARGYIRTSGRVSSVGGSAMHMKWPDDIGREAGIGRTRNRKELTIFRACPWRPALRRVTPSWSKRVGPL